MDLNENTVPSNDDDVEIVIQEEVTGENDHNNEPELDEFGDPVVKEEEQEEKPAIEAPAIPDVENLEEDEPTDTEFKQYSTGVQKRIKREIRLRKEIETNYINTQNERNQLYQIAQTGETAFIDLQNKHDALQEQYYKLLDVSMQNAIEQKTNELQFAEENGKTAEKFKLQSAIDELRYNKRQLDGIAASFNSQRTQRGDLKPRLQPMQPNTTAPMAFRWINRNSWIKEPKYVAQREYVKRIEPQLIAAGLDPNTENYYAELDRKLKKAFPPKARVSVGHNGSPVAPTSSGRGAVKSKRIVLTQDDLATMRKFGLDPSNKSHVIAFAKENR